MIKTVMYLLKYGECSVFAWLKIREDRGLMDDVIKTICVYFGL